MAVVRFEDVRAFRSAVEPLIGPSEARHNLAHGILGTVADDPPANDQPRFWLVEREAVVVAAAVRTPPRNLILCDAVDRGAATELAAAMASESERLPGAVGNTPTVEWFVTAWSEITGVFSLDSVVPQPWPSQGVPRLATAEDADLLVDWLQDFTIEAMPELPVDRDRLAEIAIQLVEQRRGAGAWLWDRDGEVLSLTVHNNPTPDGMRIGPVYTPPAERGRGFATALVAHQSTRLLEAGRRYCFLYTDLANPTSNAIYERIGYRRIAHAIDYGFHADDSRP